MEWLLRSDTVDLVAQAGFAEYFDPRDGAGLGGMDFSWTAAIDLLLYDDAAQASFSSDRIVAAFMTDVLPAELADLDRIRTTAWRLLARGVADRRSEFHTPTLATVEHDAPALRTVVLRGVEESARRLWFHSDRRSAKIPALGLNPRAAVHVYHPGLKLQLRLCGQVSVHHDDAVAAAAWSRSSPAARRTYSIDPGPGSRISAPAEARLDALDEAASRAVFVVLILEVTQMEWLTLAASVHRRARFVWVETGWESVWIVP